MEMLPIPMNIYGMNQYRWLGLLGLCLAGSAMAIQFPESEGLYHDGPGVIAPAERSQIERVQTDLTNATGAQIAVAIVPSLEGLPVEDYAHKLFARWGVGQKGKDNGILILAAIDDRRMRIEVGYGLEAKIPDGLAGDILRKQLAPAFKENEYGKGVYLAAQRISNLVQGKEIATVPGDDEQLETDPGPPSLWILVPFFSVFILIGAFMLGAGLGSKTFFPILFGSFFGGMPMVMGIAFLSELNSTLWVYLFPLMYLGTALFAFLKTKRSPGLYHAMRGSSAPGSSGWSMGARSGGSSSSGSSGGGGRSGGGGASGSW